MSQLLPVALAVDGGNSKTDVALVDGDGKLLALVRGPGIPVRIGTPTADLIASLARSAVSQAGLPADGGPVAANLVACVANADLPAEERQLEQMLRDQGLASSTTVANDTYAVLRAGLDDVPADGASRPWGVAVTCGTGINCVGIAPDGAAAGFLALGAISGDWGGAGGLGLAAQWHAVRAADGRGPQTALQQAVPAHFGRDDPLDVARALHCGQIAHHELAGLAPLLFEVARAGDTVARDLVLRLAREIFLLAKSAITRLGLTARAVPIVLGGGVLAAGHSLLIERVTTLIEAEFPAASIRVLSQAPVIGASLMGLDLAEASVRAKHALREAFSAATAAPAWQPQP